MSTPWLVIHARRDEAARTPDPDDLLLHGPHLRKQRVHIRRGTPYLLSGESLLLIAQLGMTIHACVCVCSMHFLRWPGAVQLLRWFMGSVYVAALFSTFMRIYVCVVSLSPSVLYVYGLCTTESELLPARRCQWARSASRYRCVFFLKKKPFLLSWIHAPISVSS